jgi:hypothetical protein
MAYYSLLSRLQSLQITLRDDKLLPLLRDLDKDFSHTSNTLNSARDKITNSSLEILRLETSIKSRLKANPSHDTLPDFEPESHAINSHFTQLSSKLHAFQISLSSKASLFSNLYNSAQTILTSFKTLI